MTPNETYFETFARWIDSDSAAEAQRLAERRQLRTRATMEHSGETLIDLAIDDHRMGLGGRHLFTLVKRNRTLALPWNRLRIGSPVVLSVPEQDGRRESRVSNRRAKPPDDRRAGPFPGVVSARNVRSIQVAVDHWIEGDLFDLDLAADEITRNRERAALVAVSQATGRLAQLRQIILADWTFESGARRTPQFSQPKPLPDPKGLNAAQREAIEFALAAHDLAVIHGPPGTGKTTSVVAFIAAVVARGETVLACAPSNTAVDNLLERLVELRQPVVRLGHPARVKDHLRDHSLDALVEAHPNMRWVQQLQRDAESLYQQAGRYTRARPAKGARQDMRREAKQYQAEARQLERQAVGEVLDGASVLCATTTVDEKLLGDRRFDWVVVDEACQSTEPGCWIPIQRATRVLLAGDHCQLPPTVLSQPASDEGYARSMMERLVDTYGETVTRQLKVQYRMHHQIMQFSSGQFYDSTLIADDSVHGHLLCDLPYVEGNPLTSTPATFIDTAGADYDEELEPDGASRLNPQEGRLVLAKVNQMLEAGLPAEEIAVIAPYAAQVRWLRQHTDHGDLEIDTVDGFQGREKEAVVISLVRSNRAGEIGFLADTRRMNVALTRARRKLLVIGDSATLARHPFYEALLAYFDSVGGYSSVWEEMSD
jgi:hypothetical protein